MFLVFVEAVVVAGILESIRKREAQHETVRRIIESGQPVDQELIVKIFRGNPTLSNSSQYREDVDRGIKLTVDNYTHWMPGKNGAAMDRSPALENTGC